MGNKGLFINGTLELDRVTNTLASPSSTPDDIRLIGSTLALRFELASPGLNEWVSEIVDLRHDAGWLRVDNGQAPSAAEFASVMSNLQGIYLLADFRSGAETPSFDNIRMTGIPEPSLVGLLACGGTMLLLWNRRRG